jgi:hypothetical protein
VVGLPAILRRWMAVYTQRHEAHVRHFRSWDGREEVDLIIERVDEKAARHLLWLKEQIGDDLLDVVLVNTGTRAYRRPDGIAIVPAALLGV